MAYLEVLLSAPAGSYDAVTETSAQFAGIWTVGTVNLDTLVDGYETKNRITIDRVATMSKFEVYTFEIFRLW